MTRKISVILLSLLLSSGINMLAENNNSKTAVATKTAYYSMNAIVSNSEEYKKNIEPLQFEMKQAEAELTKQESKLKTLYDELKAMRDDATKKQNDLKSKQALLSQSALSDLRTDLQELEQEMEIKAQKAASLNQQLEMRFRQAEGYAASKEQTIRGPIIKNILSIVDQLRDSQGWDAIIPVEVKVNPRVDLTKDITNILNSSFKAQAEKKESGPKAPTSKPVAKA